MENLDHPVKIGNVELKGNLFLAPVAGYSDAAFRSVCIENGACFTYTEMVSAEALVRKNLKTEILMRRAYNEAQDGWLTAALLLCQPALLPSCMRLRPEAAP